MEPTESTRETFRQAWRQYQETSLRLGVLHKELLDTTRANATLITSTRASDPVDGVTETWDASKALLAVDAIKKLANNYLAVANALSAQATALEDVTHQAIGLLQEGA